LGAEVALHETRQPPRRPPRRPPRGAVSSPCCVLRCLPDVRFLCTPPLVPRVSSVRASPPSSPSLCSPSSPSRRRAHTLPRAASSPPRAAVSSIRRTVPRFTSRAPTATTSHTPAAPTRGPTSTPGSRRCWTRRRAWVSTSFVCGRSRTSGGRGSARCSPLLGRTTSGSSSPSTVSSRERRRVASAFCSV